MKISDVIQKLALILQTEGDLDVLLGENVNKAELSMSISDRIAVGILVLMPPHSSRNVIISTVEEADLAQIPDTPHLQVVPTTEDGDK